MRVQDVMTEGVKTIAPTAPAEDARSVLRLHGIRHLVVTKANRVDGVLPIVTPAAIAVPPSGRTMLLLTSRPDLPSRSNRR